MFKILGIDHIVLRTNHIEKMLFFYCEILGCPIEKIQKEIGLTQLRAGDSIIDIIEVQHKLVGGLQNIEHFCLRVNPFNRADLESFFQENGIELSRYGNRYGAQGYGESFYIKDPEGNEVELKAAKI